MDDHSGLLKSYTLNFGKLIALPASLPHAHCNRQGHRILPSQVCSKASQSRRDVFDAQAQRLHGTEAAEVVLRQPTSNNQFTNNAKELVRDYP